MGHFAFSFLPLARRRFVAATILAIGARTAFIVFLIEAVFLAERFAAIFNDAADKRASGGEIAMLLLYASPEIFDLALAFAVLVAVYQVLLRARENRELLVMTGAGMPARSLVAALIGIALVAQLASLFVSGTVGPAAQYGQRRILFNAEYRTLRQGAPTSQFYFFPNHDVLVQAKPPTEPGRHLFIRETTGDRDRIITASRATLIGPDSLGRVALNMHDFVAYDFEDRISDKAVARIPGADPFSLRGPGPVAATHVRNVSQEIDLGALITFDPRGSTANEWTMLELLGLLPPPTPLGHAEARSLGERATRGLLCLVAPLLAGLALAATRRQTQAVALPAACVTLLLMNFSGSMLVGSLLPSGRRALLVALICLALGLVGMFVAALLRQQHALIRPALGRA